jgi:hypothetical protein
LVTKAVCVAAPSAALSAPSKANMSIHSSLTVFCIVMAVSTTVYTKGGAGSQLVVPLTTNPSAH